MANFDIIGTTVNAYKILWDERAYILRLAALPFFLKLFCFAMAFNATDEMAQHLRFTLIMLPSFLVEGWMLAHFTRLIAFGQRWPFKPTGNMEADLAVLSVRARGVLAGLIVFVLISMALGLLTAVVGVYIMPFIPQQGVDPAMVEIPPYVGILSVVMVAVMFAGFRLAWLYIPVSIGIDMKDYFLSFRGVMTTLNMIGLYFLCITPIFLVMGFLANIVEGVLPPNLASFAILVLTVFADLVCGLLVTVAMTYVVVERFKKV